MRMSIQENPESNKEYNKVLNLNADMKKVNIKKILEEKKTTSKK